MATPLPDACLETIDTDRPHQTDTPHVLPAGHTQVESAIAAAQLGGNPGAATGQKARFVFFENNYKFGVVSRVDVQLLFKHAEYIPSDARFAPPGPLGLRAKINVVESRGAVPAITLVPTVFMPVDRGQAIRGGGLVFWGWDLPWELELEMNAGLLFQGAPASSVVVVLAAALTRPLAGRLKGFVDVYATGRSVALGTGLILPVTRDIQLDAGTYVGLAGDVPAATPFLGFSIRR